MARDRHRTRAAVQRLYRILVSIYVVGSVAVAGWALSDVDHLGIPRRQEVEGIFFFAFGIFAAGGIVLHFAFQMALWAFGIEALEEDVFDDAEQEGRHDDGL